MIEPAIADLAIDANDKRRPDHRDIAIDFNRRVADGFGESAIGLQPLSELDPGLLAKAATAGARCRVVRATTAGMEPRNASEWR